MKKFVLVFSFFVLHTCQSTFPSGIFGNDLQLKDVDDRSRVVRDIVNNDYPYLASILFRDSFRCAGVIVNKNWILTLASCISGFDAESFKVRVGSIYRSNGGEEYTIKKIVTHRKFDKSSLQFDYSLIKVKSPMKFNSNITKIVVAKSFLKSGISAVVIGWGESNTLVESKVAGVEHAQCATTYKEYGISVTNNMVCGMSVSTTCNIVFYGDPLVSDNKLYGIFSWSLNCEDRRFPGVYSNVAVVKQWISNNMKK